MTQSGFAERLAHEQRAGLAAQEALVSRVGELEEALERERQNAYEHALARAELDSRIESERREAHAARHEATVHIEELEATLEREQQSAYQRAVAYADIEAQLANERRERERAATRVEWRDRRTYIRATRSKS